MQFKKIFLIILLQVVLFYGNAYASPIDREEVYIQTDRNVYIAGETIFYKCYVFNASTKKCSEISKVGYVVLRSMDSAPSLKIKVGIDKGMGDGGSVLPDTLRSGVYQIVAFTNMMKNWGEESFFYKEITIVNRFDKSLDFKLIQSASKDSSVTQDGETIVTTDKNVYNTRERVIVNIKGINSKSHVSVSVSEKPQIPINDISLVEVFKKSAGYLSSKQVSNYYSPENRNKLLRGYVMDTQTTKKVSNAIVLLSCIDTVANLQYAVTNSNGFFQMSLNDYYANKELFLTIMNTPVNNNWQIKVEDDFSLSEKWNPTVTKSKGNYQDYFAKSQNIVYINKSYAENNNEEDIRKNSEKIICPQFYHSSVTTVFPADFESLPNFFEISVELLPQVRIVKQNNKYTAQMLNRLIEYDTRSPAIFLDGVFVDDINKILSLSSDQIQKIEVIANQRAFGDLLFGGFISISSKTHEIRNSKPATYSLRVMNEDTDKGINFESVRSEILKNKHLPYIKQLLYWNPDMELNGTNDSTSFEFYTSDNLAEYIIKVEGISENGKPISAITSFKVSNLVIDTNK